MDISCDKNYTTESGHPVYIDLCFTRVGKTEEEAIQNFKQGLSKFVKRLSKVDFESMSNEEFEENWIIHDDGFTIDIN